ncbi:HAMP domain-containing sensor histidine kinase [uncultured Marivita sp.]|uniref:sensor histidine kinase n=1 Tax=uncultured Marivita sp. TaxID=888080 RepID=UPI0026129E87|nr:HAMP domain-containing sensor histidine kinase [uncultured Marivita sp.]
MIEDDGQPSMLSRVVADVIELGEGIAHPGIDLRFQSPEIVFCEGTASAVFRILANLLTNAIVAIGSNPGGVRIAARVSERGWINIVVADTGPGLGSSTASCSSGALPVSMGLGLTIAQSLTSRIGGTLKLEETGPAGTIFVLSFPIP